MTYSFDKEATLFGLTRDQWIDKANEELYNNFPSLRPVEEVKKPTIYVAGPMRGYPEFNFPAFHAAADWLREAGWEVFSPADNDLQAGFSPDGLTGEESLEEREFDLIAALKWDMIAVLDCDAIYLLNGWEDSMGARAEMNLADAAGKTIYYESDRQYCQDCCAEFLEDAEHEKPIVQQRVEASIAKDDYDRVTELGVSLGLIHPDETQKFAETVNAFNEAKDERFVAKGGEVRTTSSTGGQKGVKPERFDLIPTGALAALARHYGAGAEKYEDNQWRRGYEWSKSYAALQRHINAWWGGEDLDEETGSNHLAAVAWHAFTLLTFIEEQPDFDDRYKGVN